MAAQRVPDPEPIEVEFEFTLRARTRVRATSTSTAYHAAKQALTEIKRELGGEPGYWAEVGDFDVVLLDHRESHVVTWRRVRDDD